MTLWLENWECFFFLFFLGTWSVGTGHLWPFTVIGMRTEALSACPMLRWLEACIDPQTLGASVELPSRPRQMDRHLTWWALELRSVQSHSTVSWWLLFIPVVVGQLRCSKI